MQNLSQVFGTLPRFYSSKILELMDKMCSSVSTFSVAIIYAMNGLFTQFSYANLESVLKNARTFKEWHRSLEDFVDEMNENIREKIAKLGEIAFEEGARNRQIKEFMNDHLRKMFDENANQLSTLQDNLKEIIKIFQNQVNRPQDEDLLNMKESKILNSRALEIGLSGSPGLKADEEKSFLKDKSKREIPVEKKSRRDATNEKQPKKDVSMEKPSSREIPVEMKASKLRKPTKSKPAEERQSSVAKREEDFGEPLKVDSGSLEREASLENSKERGQEPVKKKTVKKVVKKKTVKKEEAEEAEALEAGEGEGIRNVKITKGVINSHSRLG
jgi:DNA-binding FrmR family transcriptional regulator